MLFRSLKASAIPSSNPTLIVFPFDQCNIKFKREFNPNYLEGKYSEQQIIQFLNSIEKTCDNFCILKKYILLTLLTNLLFLTGIILGSILLNLGIDNKNHSDIDFIRYSNNSFVYAGAIILGICLIQFIILMIYIRRKSKKIRHNYEEKVQKLISLYNEELKGMGLKWRLGNKFRWIELRLEFKIKVLPTCSIMQTSMIDINLKSVLTTDKALSFNKAKDNDINILTKIKLDLD